ncbi:MAG: cyanophycin synthetase [bacterium]
MQNKAFFLGIKGVGMTSLALCMQEAGWQVSGSDSEESFITDDILASKNIIVSSLDSPIPEKTDLLVYSAAYSPPSTEVRTLSLAEALAEFVKDKKVLAVAGVGGKTTTTAMLACLFQAVGRDVGYYLGTGSVAGLPAPGHSGTDPFFIVEADEYAISKSDPRPKFALLTPQILITTNIIHDHPDIYPDESSSLAVFTDLVKSINPGGTWICNPADPLTAQIIKLQGPTLKGIKVVQYGSDHPLYNDLQLSVFGDQNKLDALAAVLAALELGLSSTEALSGILSYRGAGRRQEFLGEVKGRLLYDDYGHHPLEIKRTIESFRKEFPGRRIVLVFESHTYSRTESLLKEFASAIASADLPCLMPIFESAREKGLVHQITPESFSAAVASLNPACQTLTWENAANVIVDASREGDLILTMGAGFVYKLHPEIARLLSEKA